MGEGVSRFTDYRLDKLILVFIVGIAGSGVHRHLDLRLLMGRVLFRCSISFRVRGS